MLRSTIASVCLAWLLLSTSAHAGAAYRVADITPGVHPPPHPLSSISPPWVFQARELGDAWYFLRGSRLWRTDGTPGGVELAAVLPHSPDESSLIVAGDRLLFRVPGSIEGRLWRSDGTSLGTEPLRRSFAFVHELWEVGGLAYFSVIHESGRELWRTDATETGTTHVADLASGVNDPDPQVLAGTAEGVLVAARGGTASEQIWCLDRRGRATPLDGEHVRWAVAHGDRVFYAVYGDLSAVRQLSDGCVTETALRLPASESTTRGSSAAGRLFIESSTGSLRNLSVIDRSGSTATKIASTTATAWTSVVAHDGSFYFGSPGVLWKSDGTPEGTKAIRELARPGSTAGGIVALVSANDALYVATLRHHTFDLWRSDGTSRGTEWLRELVRVHAGASLLRSANLQVVNGRAVFAAIGSTGYELYFAGRDGTIGGFANLLPDARGSSIRHLTATGRRVVFATGSYAALWGSDGTAEGTEPLGFVTESIFEHNFVPILPFGDRFLFSGFGLERPVDYELWITDGTAPGTRRLGDIEPDGHGAPDLMWVDGGVAYFSAQEAIHGRELWRTDGTPEGTRLVQDLNPGPENGFDAHKVQQEELLAWRHGLLYFACPDHTCDVYVSGGVARERSRPLTAGLRNASNFVDLGTIALFRAEAYEEGRELWVTDGTAAGTGIISNARPGPDPFTSYTRMVADRAVAYFFADDGVHGFELWRSDGTSEGTTLVADIRPGPGGSDTRETPLTTGLGLFFVADDGVHGPELWRTDGTQEGTVLVADIRPGGLGSKPGFLSWLPHRQQMLFVADDGQHGREPWVSDGTPTGTRLIEDIQPGVESGVRGTRAWAVADDRVYFVGFDARAGEELWALPLTALDSPPREDR